ncbi:MAG: cytochrome-c peroxidase [Proteobacteria bacterium]|nr:cytochrome-c peroxidase [Pseudomonadota bacterium]
MKRIVIGLILGIFCFPVCGVTGQLEPMGDVPIPKGNLQTTEKVELGKKLFFDRRLSGDGTMSCATCHDPKQSYSDGLEISLNYPTTRNWRNSPTIINAAFQLYLFHDGRAASLEEQALFPMMSAFEMNQNLDFMEEEIRSVPEYVEEFTTVFGDPDITRDRIAMAIAAFERSLISGDALLDRLLRGDESALSPEARQGYEIFIGKGKCADCHYGSKLADDRFHALQVEENPEHLKDPRIAATRRFVAKVSHFENYRTLAEDPGRFLITKDAKDWKAFRTPSLREIAGTAPYMHNGIYATLAEVIEFFNAGGGKSNTALKPLQLTAAEKKQLEIFLEEGLTGATTTFSYPKIP